MKKTFLIILSTAFLFSCKGEKTKETFYQASNGKIFTSTEYEDIKVKMSKRGEIQEEILSTTVRNDSVIKLFKTTVKEVNPYAEMNNFIGKKLPFENLIDINGNEFKIESLKGKPTLINLWFVNCPPCIEEMPQLNKLKKHYGESVNFLAVTFNNKKKVDDFLLKKTFSFTHIVDAQIEIDKLNNKSYPLNIYLDKDGIIQSYEGFLSKDLAGGKNKELENLL
ncbi:Thiol-disulfide isomerase or thioredoxin [Flavobacterium micromati]|uniref:Thiol-disulfide isomerase or thioredoxin n=1 Tax=Flavobacterium micromati TaxID=229205 RepID=A0A1M5JIH7_9FLAO|nr:TlpA disulfide reductase family protein [Flavobacterium micromati]SHG40394.1 Thiol-disulfide isomerase or thioredoxin [Flavobacterium micromati]